MGKKKRGQNPKKGSEKNYGPPDVNEYEVTDSDEEMDDGEKMLLEKVRSHSKGKVRQKSVAIMDIPSSDESDDGGDAVNKEGFEDEDADSDNDDMKSDIEGQGSDSDGLPDQKAWGKHKKNYYNTDYVDEDYGGFDGEDAEAADLEEQEAIAIQKRLTAELEGADFSLEFFTKKTPEKPEVQNVCMPIATETIKTDLSQLTSREKLNLLMKEAPELPVIAEEFQSMMSNVLTRLQKAANLVRKGHVKSEPLKFYIRSKLDLSLNYAINVVFYLNLRARRIPVNSHPVVRRLLQYRDLLEKLKPLEVAEKQIDNLLDLEAAGKLPAVSQPEPEKKSKNKLDLVAILKEQKDKKLKKEAKKTEKKQGVTVTWEDDILEAGGGGGGRGGGKGRKKEEEENDSDNDDFGLPLSNQTEKQEETDEKRAITWQIAKNKGLTPRRKKEQRNPRVKHRNRFRKAKIRRKGQVREVRNEIQKYGGEMSGIKSTVTKSIKFS